MISGKRCLALVFCFLFAVSVFGQSSAESKTLHLTFAGDCTLGGHEGWMNYSIGTFKVMAEEQGDYGYFFREAQWLFAKDDFTFVNLEGVLADSAKGLNYMQKWNFRGATQYAQILTLGSVEGVTLGNNHSEDFGRVGLNSTKDALDAAGIQWCMDEEACFFEKDGIRIAFLGFWQTNFGKKKKWLRDEIPRLKEEEGCAAVIINYHGGREYWPKHNALQTESMRFAIDCGADLVIGHHPHVLQGLEIYNNRMIVYSLGNFCYGGNRKPRAIECLSMALGAELFFEDGVFSGTRLTIHPFRISGTSPRNNYQPFPLKGEEANQVMEMIQADTPFTLEPFVERKGAIQRPVMVTDTPLP